MYNLKPVIASSLRSCDPFDGEMARERIGSDLTFGIVRLGKLKQVVLLSESLSQSCTFFRCKTSGIKPRGESSRELVTSIGEDTRLPLSRFELEYPVEE